MDLVQALILGAIQGISEWLPISSSGHLSLAQKLMGLQNDLGFDVAVHLASLFLVLLVFRKRIWELAEGSLAALKQRKMNRELAMTGMVLIATIATAAIALAFRSQIEGAFEDSRAIGIGLLGTAVLLWLSTKKFKHRGPWDPLIIGAVQGLATLPGVSRSGSTIATGKMIGMKADEAAEFSFLIFIPAVIGATVLQAEKIQIGAQESLGAYAVGAAASLAVGWFAIKFLLKSLREDKFHLFAGYCALLGAALVVLG